MLPFCVHAVYIQEQCMPELSDGLRQRGQTERLRASLHIYLEKCASVISILFFFPTMYKQAAISNLEVRSFKRQSLVNGVNPLSSA